MKIAVLGAGAVGSMLGGLIKRHDPDMDLVLIARGEHGKRMRERGVVALEGPWGLVETPVLVSSRIEDAAGSDYVLLTVKSQATESAIRAASPHLQDAVVISIQNGVNQPVLRRYVRPDRLVMGVTAANMAIREPGTVSMQRDGVTVIGPGAAGRGRMDVVRAAGRLLRKSRLRIAENRNILGVQYNKLAFNTVGCACSLSASNLLSDGVLHRPWRNAVAIPLHRESLDVLVAAGIRLVRTPSAADAFRFGRLLRTLNWPILGPLTGWVVRRFFNAKPLLFSLHLDLLHGKPTEVDFINGEIVRLAKRSGVEAVLNATVVEMVRELERRGGGGFFTREEVISRFQKLQR